MGVHIGRYESATGELTFFYYPIEEPPRRTSELVALKGSVLVVERDNGGSGRIKRIWRFPIAGLDPQPRGGDVPARPKGCCGI